jgi:hypothetical protein
MAVTHSVYDYARYKEVSYISFLLQGHSELLKYFDELSYRCTLQIMSISPAGIPIPRRNNKRW